MPSSRWLLLAVITVCSTPWMKPVISAELSNPLQVSSNGWRPIVGTREVKPYKTIEEQLQSKAPTNTKQTISLTSSLNDSENKNKNEKNNKQPPQNNKGPASGNQVHINHHGSTGHHLKLQPPLPSKQPYKTTGHGNMHVMVTGKPAHRHPVMNKLHAHMALSAKRPKPNGKPVISRPHQHQHNHGHGLRDEIMAPAPSSAIGSYAYFNQGPLIVAVHKKFRNLHNPVYENDELCSYAYFNQRPISIQNTQLGGKPFHSPGNVDFSNHFAFSNVNNDLVLPHQQFSFQKHPNQNELQPNHFLFINHDDEFTRNLVPPPPIYKPQGEKETVIINKPQKAADQPTSVVSQHIQVGKPKDEVRHIPENILVQLPPSYTHFQQQFGKPEFDLEITKENFKEYHTTLAPTTFKPPVTESYINLPKYTKQRNTFKTPPTYEVTEEKEWLENFPGFNSGGLQFNHHLSTASRPLSTSGHQLPTASPDINKFHFPQPPVLLSQEPAGQFLPTPYNPESAFPTSPTQADVSTVYSEVLNKKKRPLPTESTKYNIKEVATHFPIFEETQPVPLQTNGGQKHTSLEHFPGKYNSGSSRRKPGSGGKHSQGEHIPSRLNQEERLKPNTPEEYNPGEFTNEITTKKPVLFEETENTMPYVKPTQQTTFPTRGTTHRRPSHRRRRPTRPTSTTTQPTEIFSEVFEAQKPQIVTEDRTTEKPYYRRRRPIKYRTTEAPQEQITSVETSTRPSQYYRPNPTRGQSSPSHTVTEEIYKNHRRKPAYRPTQEGEETQEFTTRFYTKFERPLQKYKHEEETYDQEKEAYREQENTDREEESMYREQGNTYRGQENSYRNQEDTYREQGNTYRGQGNTNREQGNAYREQGNTYRDQEKIYKQQRNTHRGQESTHRDSENTYREQENYKTRSEEENMHQGGNLDHTDVATTEYNHNYASYPEGTTVGIIDQPIRSKSKRKRIRPVATTTEILPATILNIPENELDYSTTPSSNDQSDETITIKEVFDYETEKEVTPTLTTSPTTTTSTTTTEAPASTKSHRIRQRPIKYDVQRPRFSVKDYRQRLNQYMSSSTTEPTPRQSSEPSVPKIRYPNRFKVPSPTMDAEESTEAPIRQKFMPKDPRYKYQNSLAESSDTSTTEKYVRTVNPRIRPFGRYRSTTESSATSSTTPTPKVSIKPKIFTNLRRPQQLSLRNRIYNRKLSTTTTEVYTPEVLTPEPEVEDLHSENEDLPSENEDLPSENEDLPSNTEKTEVTIPFFESAESKIEYTTQFFEIEEDPTTTSKPTESTTRFTTYKPTQETIVTPDEAEAFLQLQRISDLTSSAHKQYNTPGMFKSVSPTSRRVPSYFTIATEDPILPIEAFFPNLNHKLKK